MIFLRANQQAGHSQPGLIEQKRSPAERRCSEFA
jgi:hypothetical protein